MRINLVPDNLIIFLGQKFTVQINITDCDFKIMWVSAQIAGKIKSLKQSTNTILKTLFQESYIPNQNSPVIQHVVSGSRLISAQFQPPKSFCVFITADNIPPSYEGEGINVSYELRFSAQILGQPVNSISIPIHFVSPHLTHYNFDNIQSNSKFDINALESVSVPAPFALSNPFQESAKRPIENYQIRNDGNEIAVISMSPDVFAGTEVDGLIDLRQSNTQVDLVIISITRNEIYEANGINESNIIETKQFDMKNAIAKRFNIPISFNAVAEFSTDIFIVSYSIDFRFQMANEFVQWSTPLHIFPPQISLSTPRSPINIDKVK